MNLQEVEYRARERDEIARQARQEEADRTANRDFVQVYPSGWQRLRELLDWNPNAAKLWSFLAEHIDGTCGTVVVSQDVLADELGVSIITIKRHTKALEERGALVRIRVGTGVYAYALNPDDVWKSWDKQKKTAAFVTKTLVKKTDKENGVVRRQLSAMLRERKAQFGLNFDPETGEIFD